MRQFRSLDPTALKAFFHAAANLNFTKAASEAGFTQSGISQHVASLERELGNDLFKRVGRKLILTPLGGTLYKYVDQYLDGVEELFEVATSERRGLKGWVRYAMPDSCLMTPHFQNLLEQRSEFPGIDLNVQVVHSEEVIALLLKGEIDFGFVTKKMGQPGVAYSEFATEKYVLTGGSKADMNGIDSETLNDQDFVNYPGMDVFSERWQRQHFPRKKIISILPQRIHGQITSLRGAITMVENGVGLGFFPFHCVENLIKLKRLKIFKGREDEKHSESIYIVQLSGGRQSARAARVLEAFWKMV